MGSGDVMAYQTVKDAMKAMADNVRSTYFSANYSDPLSLTEMVNSVLGKPVNIGNLNNGLTLMADRLRHGSTNKMTLEQIINAIQPVWAGKASVTKVQGNGYFVLVPYTNLDKFEKLSNYDLILGTHLSKVSFVKSDGSGTLYSIEDVRLDCYPMLEEKYKGQVFIKEVSAKVYQIDIIWRIPKGAPAHNISIGMKIDTIKNATMKVDEKNLSLDIRLLP